VFKIGYFGSTKKLLSLTMKGLEFNSIPYKQDQYELIPYDLITETQLIDKKPKDFYLNFDKIVNK